MTRSEVHKVWQEIEYCRRMAEWPALMDSARQQWFLEYARLWRLIKPYVTGAEPYADGAT
jgi:hypothetical protein